MAKPSYQTVSAPGTAAYYPDWMQSPFNMTWVLEVPAGVTVSYTVQWTADDINDTSWTPVWLADSVAGTAQTASQGNFYMWPIRGIRVTVASVSGGSVRFAVLEGMSSR